MKPCGCKGSCDGNCKAEEMTTKATGCPNSKSCGRTGCPSGS
jgi:hypothetical protein